MKDQNERLEKHSTIQQLQETPLYFFKALCQIWWCYHVS